MFKFFGFICECYFNCFGGYICVFCIMFKNKFDQGDFVIFELVDGLKDMRFVIIVVVVVRDRKLGMGYMDIMIKNI